MKQQEQGFWDETTEAAAAAAVTSAAWDTARVESSRPLRNHFCAISMHQAPSVPAAMVTLKHEVALCQTQLFSVGERCFGADKHLVMMQHLGKTSVTAKTCLAAITLGVPIYIVQSAAKAVRWALGKHKGNARSEG
ncbi:expressed unknown protein [Ectocarpus siliculosus]|uniref:Uncharacterized protein n=1 Tax=Ectocarpus siliculosus TaxID=2880 RepID=D7FNA4_ECTSI|nr:expressed unknown protein [Ectocarpus siliculosus]|eukprot:CBJ30161.1 expressed unknown protein [Ectocarpus siliculosus]